MQWPKTRLGDLYEVHNGLSKPREAFGSGWPFLSYSVVFNNFFLPKTLDSLVQSTDKEQTSYSIKAGDIFVTRTSETPDELGMSCVALKDYPHATYNGFCKRLRPTTDKVHPGYIGYYLRTPEFRSRLAGLGASMITRASLRNEDLLSLTVSIPPLAIQQSIAERLARYDALIENNARRIAILENKTEQLYKEWFVRRRFPGHDCATNGDIPTEWREERLGNLAEISTGKCNREDAEEDGIYPLFDRSQEIKRSNEWIKDCEAIIVPGEGTSFMPRYYKGKFNLHQRCYCVEPRMKDTGKFLFYVIMLNRRYFLSVATGATVPSLRQKNFLSMKVLWPNMELVAEFDKYATHIFKLKDNLQRQNALLAKERDLLLPRLMSGRMKP